MLSRRGWRVTVRMSHARNEESHLLLTQYHRYLKQRCGFSIGRTILYIFLIIYFRAILLIILFSFVNDRVPRDGTWEKYRVAQCYLFTVHQLLSKSNGYRCTPEATVDDVCARVRACVRVVCDLVWVHVWKYNQEKVRTRRHEESVRAQWKEEEEGPWCASEPGFKIYHV